MYRCCDEHRTCAGQESLVTVAVSTSPPLCSPSSSLLPLETRWKASSLLATGSGLVFFGMLTHDKAENGRFFGMLTCDNRGTCWRWSCAGGDGVAAAVAAAQKGGGHEAVGASMGVYMVFSQDKVLQRCLEQIIDDDKVGLDRVQQRFVEQNFETPRVVLVEV